MRWLIKSPSPKDLRRNLQWGDTHFARALARALSLIGHRAEIDFRESWQDGQPADVVVVLRGLYRYDRSRSADPEALHALWLISHPDDVTDAELDEYDIVFVASKAHASDLEARLKGRVFCLPQCTNTETFFPSLEGPSAAQRSGVLFVGNTRGQRRIPVELAHIAPDIRIHGMGWSAFRLDDLVVTETIDNYRLGNLYRGARLSLNDHWADMREYGYLNNRVFDSLACGLPVLSDSSPEITRVFGKECGVVEAEPGEYRDAYFEALLSYSDLLEQAGSVARRVCREHGFHARAREMEAAVFCALGESGIDGKLEAESGND